MRIVLRANAGKNIMQTASAYNPIRIRNVPQEMAELARERGGMTEADLKAEGFTKDEIARHAPKAAELLRAAEIARAA